MTNEFFNELGTSLSKATQSAVGKTSAFFESQKINLKLTAEKAKLDKLYETLGGGLISRIEDGSIEVGDDLKEVVAEITERKSRIAALQGDLAEAKGKRICEECGNYAFVEDVFCPKCGSRLPEIPVDEIDAPEFEDEEMHEEVKEAVEAARAEVEAEKNE